MLGTIVPTSLLNLLRYIIQYSISIQPNRNNSKQNPLSRFHSLSLDRHQSVLFISQIGLTAAAAALATITITTPTTITSGHSCTTRGNQNGTAVTTTLPILVRLLDRPRQHLPGLLPATVDTRLMDVHVLPISMMIFKNQTIFISLLPRKNNALFLRRWEKTTEN